MTTTDYTRPESRTYAREAERSLSWLGDKTADLDPGDPAQAIAAGLAAVANALLSVDDAIRWSAGVDVPNAMAILADRVSDVSDAIDDAHRSRRDQRDQRRRLQPHRRHEIRLTREALADAEHREMAGVWQARSNAAYLAATTPRVPWWKPAGRADRQALSDARARLDDVAAQCSEETDEFADANHAVILAAARVPWWQR
jgi:hypothetical protein